MSLPASLKDPIAYWNQHVPTHEQTSEFWPTIRGDSSYLIHGAGELYRIDYYNGAVSYRKDTSHAAR